MSRVAEEVRRRHEERVAALSAAERVELALELGWRAMEDFRRSQGLSRKEALAILRARRQEGRQPCSFLGGGR